MEHVYDYTPKACDTNFTPSDDIEFLSNCSGDVHKQTKYRTIPVIHSSLDGPKTPFDNTTKVSGLFDYQILNTPQTNETECLSSISENIHRQNKYRTHPVGKSFGDSKLPSTCSENVSGVKEIKNVNVNEDSTCNSGLNAVLNRVQARSNKLRSRMESKHSINTVQQKINSNKPFLQKNRQVSISEPLLVVAKDRGDNIGLENIYGENDLLEYSYRGEKQSASMNHGIEGCIYIKRFGKIYKSFIRAENVPNQVDEVFPMPLGLRNKKSSRISVPFGNSKLKNQTGLNSIFGANGLKFENEETGDFEIAIFLSGINNISGLKLKKESMATGCKKNESAEKTDGKMKKKINLKRKDSKTSLIQRKKIGASRKAYPSSLKILKINDQENEKTFTQKSHINRVSRFETRAMNKTYRVNNLRYDMSSGSDTEYVYELPERVPKNMRPMKQKSTSKSNIVNDTVTQRENVNRNPKQYSNFWENDEPSFFTNQMSRFSINDFGNAEYIPKVKISDEKLQERFEIIFKRYATTTRHSGEVIPRKISTEWMMNAGVVDEILSEREADNAFRQAAGTKITMNSQEYKEFIIMLTLRKKLPYYEIYRRMCNLSS